MSTLKTLYSSEVINFIDATKGFDYHYYYSDSNTKYHKGLKHDDSLVKAFKLLSSSDKKIIANLFKANCKGANFMLLVESYL